MAYNEQVQQDLIGLIVGMFDAAPGNAIFNDVAEAYQAGASYADIADTLAGTDEFKSLYPSFLTNAQFVERLVNNMLDGHVSDADQVQDVIDAFVVEMSAGATRAQVALTAADVLRNVDPADPVFGQAAVAFNNKVDVATYYSIDAGQSGDDLAELQAVLAGVDHTDASVDAARDAIDGTGTGGGDAAFLTANQDVVSGGAGDDLFIADVVAVDGLQVNSLNTGDRLDGGAGNDTLEAHVTKGATHGGLNMPIAARTTNIENVTFEAINASQGLIGSLIGNTDVYIDAGNMVGLSNIGSSHSVGNLVIQNLTTRDNNGNLRLPSDLTITMSHTGTNNSAWDESDLHVYFAQNNLLTDVESDTTPSQANYWLLDQDSTDYKNKPLQNIDRDGITFTLDGVAHGVRPADSALLDVNDWEEFAQGIRDELAVMAAVAPELAGITVIVDWDNIRQTYNDDGVLIDIPAITLLDSNGGEFSNLGFIIPQDITGDFNVFGRTDTLAPVTTSTEYITTNVELEKVGRGGDGGELVIGGMEKGQGENNYRDVNGIEQFNVTVVGGEELPNSLSALRSTYNQLQIVNIESAASGNNGYASLQIGNGNTAFGEYGLKDVRVVNAVDFHGDLSISAEITTESFAKYVDLFDSVGNFAEDNVYFDYSLTGEGDNSLWLDVDMALSAHEDFVLSVLTDGGDDVVVVRLDSGNSFTQNRYDNQSDLDNVTIGTGAGDDVIWTPGNGDVTINAGSGDDTVYSDNTGSQTIVNAQLNSLVPNGSELNAHWVTNSVNTNIHDLLGEGTGGQYFLYGSTLTVTFSGASVNAVAGVTTGVAAARDNGFEGTAEIPTNNGYVATHANVNQAIKDAINNDPVLSKLLVAKDGPNNSLVIESLIDGEFEATDLQITLNGPSASQIGALSNAQLQQLNTAYRDFQNDSTASLGGSNTAVAATLNGQLTNLGNNYNGINGSRLATDGELTVQIDEVQTIDFAGFGVPTGGAGDINVGTIPVALADGDTAADIAAKVQAAINGQVLGNAPSAVTAVVNGTVVEITYASADGDVSPVVVAGGTATVETNLVPVAEQQTINFTGVAAAGVGNIGVGGILVNVNDTMTADQIATAVAAAINASGTMTDPLGSVTATSSGAVVTVEFSVLDGDVAAINVVNGSTTLAPAPVVADDFVAYDPVGTGSAGDIADAPVVTVADGQIGGGVGVVISGEDSNTQSDNVINLGSGQDVVVLSTSDAAEETLVWTGHNNGHNTIVNFTETGAGIDQIDFSAYLTTQTSHSGSAASAVAVATSVQFGQGVVNANEVVITSFASLGTATGVSWNNLSASSLEAALNQNNANWTRGTTSDLYGNTNKAVFMVENGGNDGEYKIFEVAFTNSGSGLNSGFTVVELVGVADFGDSISGVTAANFV